MNTVGMLLVCVLERTNFVRPQHLPIPEWTAVRLLRDAGMERHGPVWVPGPKTLDWILSVKFYGNQGNDQ